MYLSLTYTSEQVLLKHQIWSKGWVKFDRYLELWSTSWLWINQWLKKWSSCSHQLNTTCKCLKMMVYVSYTYVFFFINGVRKKFYTSGIGNKTLSKIIYCTQFILITISISLTISVISNNHDIMIIISFRFNNSFLFGYQASIVDTSEHEILWNKQWTLSPNQIKLS